MGDLHKYVKKRKLKDLEFGKDYNEGFKNLRKEACLTQQDLVDKLGSQKSAISRMEKHAEVT
jgi:HTH-type transcriptional regulator / antitoxin HipB